MRLEPIRAGDPVEVTGRLIAAASGDDFYRPRRNPAEPDSPEEKQSRRDGTNSKVRVFGWEALPGGLPIGRGLWVTLWGTFNGDSIDVTGASPAPKLFDDNWSSHPSIEAIPDGESATEWSVTKRATAIPQRWRFRRQGLRPVHYRGALGLGCGFQRGRRSHQLVYPTVKPILICS